MAKIEPVQSVAQRALYEFLKARLATTVASEQISVSEDWPEPTVGLPKRGVTILSPGPPEEDTTSPELVGKVSNANPTANPPVLAVYQWRLAYRRQSLQLDCWATTKPDIEDVAARVERALRTGSSGFGEPPVNNTLVLNLSALGVSSYAQFAFEPAGFMPTADRVQQHEYRASIAGMVDVVMTLDAPSRSLAEIRLRQYAMPRPDHGQRFVATVSATAETYSRETY